jgi:hypothetical protein
MQIPLLTTRFNNQTWKENYDYKKRNNIKGCIYGSATKIKESIPLNNLVFIIEMNNSTNKIEGIGLVFNITHFDKYYKIYDSGTYNRYIYKSNYIIDNNSLPVELLELLEKICFKGKTHLKRGIGFTSIPEKLKRMLNCDIHSMIKNEFIKKFGKNVIETYKEEEKIEKPKKEEKKKKKLKIID